MSRIIAIYKKAYSGLSPAAWWLSLVMLINRSGTMVIPFMSLYLTQSLGYTMKHAGIVMSLFGVGAICGGYLGGKLADRFGFYTIQLAALAGGGILFMFLGQMRSFELICLFTFLLSLVNDAFRPANAMAIAHYSNEENRTRSFSLNRLSINLGWAAGGSLGGFIASKNYELLFWVDGCTNVGAALLLLLVLSPRRNAHTPKKHERIVRDKTQSVYKDKHYMIFIALTVLFAYCFFQLFTTQPVFFKKNLGLSEEFIGFTMALNGVLIGLFEMVVVHSIEGKRDMLSYMAFGTFVIALSFLIFNVLPGAAVLALLAMVLCTVGEIFAMPFMNTFWISRSNDNNRGQYAALLTISWSIAQVLGPGTGSLIADEYGFHALWWLVSGLLVVCGIGYLLLQRAIARQRG
ncbi:MAG: MFS transporter [Flavipsychrobacter sp.]|nr:MFS transporter [Flavipsychrobacter sp.]